MRQRLQRQKNERHLAFIRELPCIICGDNTTTEAAHIRSPDREYGKRPTGGAEKPDDLWTLPLCGRHHREQHKANELNFYTNEGINPFVMALSLFAASGDYELAEEVIAKQGAARGR